MSTQDTDRRDEDGPPLHGGDGAYRLAGGGGAAGPGGGVTLDEEPPEHVPGSFLAALPQFFVFPLILVATLTVLYLGLRWLAGVDAADAAELFAELRVAGPHSRWQIAQQLADGLDRGRFDLAAVPADDIAEVYADTLREEEQAGDAKERERASLMRQYLLNVMAYKRDPALTRHAVEALGSPADEVRRAALVALWRMADPASVDALLSHLRGPQPEERWIALGVLGVIGTPEALDGIAELLGGDDTLGHRNAVLALAVNGDARASRYLPSMLQRESYASDPALDDPDLAGDADSRLVARAEVVDQFLMNAARASATLGDRSLVPQLEALRRDDPSVRVRSAAINALHDLGGTDPED